MVVISKKAIQQFTIEYPESKNALEKWYIETKKADWPNFAAARKTFNTTDSVGNGLFVFDIHGNKYRLIARIIFGARTVFIKFIGTHKDYDKVDLDNL